MAGRESCRSMFASFEGDLPRSRSTSATPEFMVGRDREGHWLAVETHGRAGGLFVNQEAALRYAAFESEHRSGAVQVVNEPLALRL